MNDVSNNRSLITCWYLYFQPTMFKHPREAQAILQEQVTYHMLRGGIRWGAKIGIVVFAYVTMCQVSKSEWGSYRLNDSLIYTENSYITYYCIELF